MWRNWGLWIAALSLVFGMAMVRLGAPEERVSLKEAATIWADLLRDTQEIGLSVTRMSDSDEIALGRQVAAAMLASAQRDAESQAYVTAIAKALLPYVQRRRIEYEFHVVKSPQVNAFALPGGQIVIFTGMLALLESEAEVAMILGHEIAHVDQYHVAELYQLAQAGKRLGLGRTGEYAEVLRRMTARGYAQHQESDADSEGFRLAVEAGYHPSAGRTVWTKVSGGAIKDQRRPSSTPVDEAASVLGEALTSYGRSHPSHADRFVQLARLEADLRSPKSSASTRTYYWGRENHQRRIARTQTEFPGESRRP